VLNDKDDELRGYGAPDKGHLQSISPTCEAFAPIFYHQKKNKAKLCLEKSFKKHFQTKKAAHIMLVKLTP